MGEALPVDFQANDRKPKSKDVEATSVLVQKLAPDDAERFIKDQLDRCGLSHATFTPEAIQLIARSSEGALRAVKNLCIGSLLEAVRDRTRTVDLKQVNRVLLQPHWRPREDMLT